MTNTEDICRIAVTMLPDGRMDTKNASLYLGLAEKTLAIMRSEGTGPLYLKKGRIFYYQSDLDAWLDEGPRCRSTAQTRFHQSKPREGED